MKKVAAIKGHKVNLAVSFFALRGDSGWSWEGTETLLNLSSLPQSSGGILLLKRGERNSSA